MSESSSEQLVDALNSVVLATAGVNELFPPQNVVRTAADQLIAFVKGDDSPPLRTVLVESHGDGLKITARIGVRIEHRTPEVVCQVASAIRDFVHTQINPEVRCVASVHAVSIQ
ncbi:hypothetical protein [Psychromicrobium lacuslunae]|uniref:Asp23/Gls24 family envelope stress response protein n=1 Tax=Psychromicrobium lacuslunae TaxID=1618207 RepID=A0A0D4C218_9MICC|nr:hypothetical protein [Psychromicrobium lacuslunae]AJT42623.1 hypothetical protein UM93_16155 [Psychromicrobium lacuslunae]